MSKSFHREENSRNAPAAWLDELTGNALSAWLSRHLHGRDSLLSRTSESSLSYAVAALVPHLSDEAADRMRAATAVLLSGVANGEDWDPDAVAELLRLVTYLKPDGVNEPLSRLAQDTGRWQESPILRRGLLQAMVAVEIPTDQRFWHEQLNSNEDEFVAVVFSGLALINVDVAIDLLPRLSDSADVAAQIGTVLPSLLTSSDGDHHSLTARLYRVADQSQPQIAAEIYEFTNSLEAVETDSTSTQMLFQATQGNREAWRRIVEDYTGLVMHWLARDAVKAGDRTDICQEVFRAVLRSINRFDPERSDASFRGWLRRITRNKVLDYQQAQFRKPHAEGGTTNYLQFLNVAEPESGSSTGGSFRNELLKQSIERTRKVVDEDTWQAFWETTVVDRPAAEVAADLGKTPAAVRQAKHRVMCMLRRQMSEST